jgi:DNA gyrase/topoisomerase IV subunit A
MMKESGGLLKMGPIWDYDLAMGNLYNDFGDYTSWANLSQKHEYIEDNWLCYLMNDPPSREKLKARWDEVKDELLEIRRKFGDARRTEITEATEEIDLEDLIEKHTCVITVSHTGYIKRQHADVYSAQNRGGKGIIGMTTKEDDFVEDVIVAHSHSLLMFFTNKGRVYAKKAYRIPEASRTAKGTNLVNIIELTEGEFVTAIVPIKEFT